MEEEKVSAAQIGRFGSLGAWSSPWDHVIQRGMQPKWERLPGPRRSRVEEVQWVESGTEPSEALAPATPPQPQPIIAPRRLHLGAQGMQGTKRALEPELAPAPAGSELQLMLSTTADTADSSRAPPQSASQGEWVRTLPEDVSPRAAMPTSASAGSMLRSREEGVTFSRPWDSARSSGAGQPEGDSPSSSQSTPRLWTSPEERSHQPPLRELWELVDLSIPQGLQQSPHQRSSHVPMGTSPVRHHLQGLATAGIAPDTPEQPRMQPATIHAAAARPGAGAAGRQQVAPQIAAEAEADPVVMEAVAAIQVAEDGARQAAAGFQQQASEVAAAAEERIQAARSALADHAAVRSRLRAQLAELDAITQQTHKLSAAAHALSEPSESAGGGHSQLPAAAQKQPMPAVQEQQPWPLPEVNPFRNAEAHCSEPDPEAAALRSVDPTAASPAGCKQQGKWASASAVPPPLPSEIRSAFAHTIEGFQPNARRFEKLPETLRPTQSPAAPSTTSARPCSTTGRAAPSLADMCTQTHTSAEAPVEEATQTEGDWPSAELPPLETQDPDSLAQRVAAKLVHAEKLARLGEGWLAEVRHREIALEAWLEELAAREKLANAKLAEAEWKLKAAHIAWSEASDRADAATHSSAAATGP